MLLLLKQTIGTDEILFFGDENSLVNLGSFREVIHGHKEDALLELEFGCKVQEPFTIPLRDQFNRYIDASLNVESFTFNATIFSRENRVSVQEGRYHVKSENEEQVVNGDFSTPSIVLGPRTKPENKGQVITGSFSGKIYGQSHHPDSSRDPITRFASEFRRLFAHVYPLGPTRVQPKRIYHWEGTHPESIGQSGENMIDSLLNARVDQRTTPYEGKNVPIEKRISWWLREMDLGYAFSIKRSSAGTDRDYDVLIQKTPDSAKVTLADMGYGLAQFLPVLVHCYYAPEGSTLILEQPGMHLHPKVQSQLADLLIEVITERNLQILIESHSEHLLNRLQRRIAEEKISAAQTALYFCRNDEGESRKDRLIIDEFGNIENWPENFFGDEMGDLFAMTEAQRERQKRAEG